MKTFLYACLLFLVSAPFVNAQSPVLRTPKSPTYASWLSANLMMGIPMQEYAASTKSLPFGLNVNYIYQPSVRVPLGIGVNVGYLNVGTRSIERALTADITAGGVLLDQLYIPLRFEITNNIVQAHVNGRFIAPTNTVKPYVDGLAGLNYLWTSTSVYDDSPERYFATDEDGLITSKTQLDDLTWSVGAGGGLMVQVGKKLHITAGTHYLFGGRAQYYDRSQIEDWDIQLNVTGVTQGGAGQGSFEPGDLTYGAVPKKSRTDMLTVRLGVTYDLAK
jgi:hypothetical protein